MATCPSCGSNSRTDPTFVVEPVLVAKPFGTFSVAGVQTKTVTSEVLRLSHSCGWSVTGHIDGDHLVTSSEGDNQ